MILIIAVISLVQYLTNPTDKGEKKERRQSMYVDRNCSAQQISSHWRNPQGS